MKKCGSSCEHGRKTFFTGCVCVCVAVLDRCSDESHLEISMLGQPEDAVGPDLSVTSVSGGPTILLEAFCQHLSNGYRQKLIEYPNFDHRHFKYCLQQTAFSVFGSLADSQLLSSLWICWKALSHEIGCHLAPPWGKLFWRTIWPWHISWMLWLISLMCGRWSCHTLWKRGGRTTALVLS